MTKGFGDPGPAGIKGWPGRKPRKHKPEFSLTLQKTQKRNDGTIETTTHKFELKSDGKIWYSLLDSADVEYGIKPMKPKLVDKKFVDDFDIGFRFQYDMAVALLRRWFEDWSD